MKRVQIYLEDDQYDRLKVISNGRDMARLVREAVDIAYPKRDKDSFISIVHELAGIWKGRTDLDISRKGKKRRDHLASFWTKNK